MDRAPQPKNILWPDCGRRDKEEQFYIYISKEESKELLFLRTIPEQDPPTFGTEYKAEYFDPAEIGYVADEKFEEALRKPLVDEGLVELEWTGEGEIDYPALAYFGETGEIAYNESESDYQKFFANMENTESRGQLKENWFYHVRTYE